MKNNSIDNKEMWENALVDIELSISKANFSTWFKDTYISKIEDSVVWLSVPNEFVRDWLSNKFHTLVLKTLRKSSNTVRGVEYIINKNNKKQAQ